MKGVLYHFEHFYLFIIFPPLQLNSRSCIICCHCSRREAVDVTAGACCGEGTRLHPTWGRWEGKFYGEKRTFRQKQVASFVAEKEQNLPA